MTPAVERLADALRRQLSRRATDSESWAPQAVTVEEQTVVLAFRRRDDPATYLVHLGSRGPLVGLSTGELCDNPEQWAIEVQWRIDEEVGSHTLDTLARTFTTDGVLLGI